MEKFKGTPGEWHPNVISTITIGVNAEIEKEEGWEYSKNVCEFILPETDDEYELQREEIVANANLIATSPELLTELQRLVKWCRSLKDWSNTEGSELDPPIEDAEKVINKALGNGN